MRPSAMPAANNQNPSFAAAESVKMYLMSVSPSLFPFSLGHHQFPRKGIWGWCQMAPSLCAIWHTSGQSAEHVER